MGGRKVERERDGREKEYKNNRVSRERVKEK